MTPPDAEAFFDAARKEQITGIAAAGGAATLDGTGNVAQLEQAKKIQNAKILFHKLSKSFVVYLKTTWVPWSSWILLNSGLEPSTWPFSYTISDSTF